MFSYENLEVYKKAFLANKTIYRLVQDMNTVPRYIKDQLGRASVSIMLNIAEGSGKFGEKDRRKYYITARGSVFECASLIHLLRDENELSNEVFIEMLAHYEELSRMLFVMIRNLT